MQKIVTIHGAGLGNIIFCNNDEIIERKLVGNAGIL